jgi:hypothetical protein
MPDTSYAAKLVEAIDLLLCQIALLQDQQERCYVLDSDQLMKRHREVVGWAQLAGQKAPPRVDPYIQTDRTLKFRDEDAEAVRAWVQALRSLRDLAQAEGTSKSGDDAKAKGPPSEGDAGEATWYTVTEAAKIAGGVNTGVITRAVDDGQLKSNGKQGRERRIDAVDLCRWLLVRAGRPEPEESDQQVNRLGDKHFRD